MVYTAIVFLHLLATCAAIGTIVITDLRLLGKVMGYRVVIPRPERFETTIISLALLVLYATGAAIVWMALEKNPQYLHNQKLQAKLVLVLILSINAVYLHKRVFSILERSRPVSKWKRSHRFDVSIGVALSNSLWFFCAFLGIARPWNNTVPIVFVLCVAVAIWLGMFIVVNAILHLASRDEPRYEPDLIDIFKTKMARYATPTVNRRRPPPAVSDRRKTPRPLVSHLKTQ